MEKDRKLKSKIQQIGLWIVDDVHRRLSLPEGSLTSSKKLGDGKNVE